MFFNTYVSSADDIQAAAKAGIAEVLIEPAAFAQQGKLSKEESCSLAMQAIQHGLQAVLVWDILMPEERFLEARREIGTWDLSLFDAIRVLDHGAAYFIKEEHPELPLQLMFFCGSRNNEALLGWCELFGSQLERLVLSLQAGRNNLLSHIRSLPVDCELLAAGRISIFYSARKLISAQSEDEQSEESGEHLKMLAASPEYDIADLPTIETEHGTLLFLDRDHFILDALQDFEEAGLHSACIDLRHISSPPHSAQGIETLLKLFNEDPAATRAWWPAKTAPPFFYEPEDDSQLKQLKSPLLQLRAEAAAEVISIESGRYAVLHTLKEISTDGEYRLQLPNGALLDFKKPVFRTPQGQDLTECSPGQIVLTPWRGKLCNGALLLASPRELEHKLC